MCNFKNNNYWKEKKKRKLVRKGLKGKDKDVKSLRTVGRGLNNILIEFILKDISKDNKRKNEEVENATMVK